MCPLIQAIVGACCLVGVICFALCTRSMFVIEDEAQKIREILEKNNKKDEK